ncbi:MAG TPA: hypothetical protein VM032_08425 [Vicinamibacterales bacterium]|nr:hypothetical protein [Vicinamibacterales bacterium]
MSSLRSRQTSRLGPAVEWLLAASFLACLVALGALIVREVRAAPLPPLSAPVARLLSSSVPTAVPSRAVSVAMLPFRDGKELKVGDSVESVATTLGRAAEVGRQEVDRGAYGERLTRFYEYSGARFVLVFEPVEQNGQPRLAGIYLP